MLDDKTLAQQFVQFAIESKVLKFGEFQTKAARLSPYFFNAGLFNDGKMLNQLANFYAQKIINSKVDFDMIFGPAYKGIPLATAICMQLAKLGKNVPFAYNRKEAKDHGEGGNLVGAKVQGKVLVVDDVMSAGTAIKESVALIHQAGAKVVAVAVAIDRQEKAKDLSGVDVNYSAVQFVRKQLGIKVINIANLNDLLSYLQQNTTNFSKYYQAILNYRQQYGVDD